MAVAVQLDGVAFHLAVCAAVLSELAPFFDLALTGWMGAFVGHHGPPLGSTLRSSSLVSNVRTNSMDGNEAEQ
jgi:hypothetical protein